jgi:hypothetical protein
MRLAAQIAWGDFSAALALVRANGAAGSPIMRQSGAGPD